MSNEGMGGTPDVQKWEALLTRLDADLVRAQAELGAPRDEEAWAELHRRVLHYAELFRRKPPPKTRPDPWLLEDAWGPEDITQEVCAKLQSRTVLAKLRAARKPAAYLVRMLRNAEGDLLRRRMQRRRIGIPLENLEGGLPDPGAGVVEGTSGMELLLQWAVAQMLDEDRDLYRERYVLRRSLQQIADQLGISYSAVGVRVHRLKKRLRGLMEG